ncbi:MAG: hypothetical protein ACLFQ0_11760 [Cyclobacteriaceae bacterium]
MRTFFITLYLLVAQNAALQAQATIVVKNDYKQEAVYQQARFYADLFGFDESVHIIINFSLDVPKGHHGYTRYHDAHPLNGGHQLLIKINRKSNRVQQLMTLVHEMIHARQFVEGELQQCGPLHYSWKNEKICQAANEIPYRDRPWEKEAHEETLPLYRLYREQALTVAQR